MSKSVLLSIQPYWVFLIVAKSMGWNINKEKTIEVRKSYPKDENWDKVIKIYCGKDKKSFAKIPKEYQSLMKQYLGKVIGEFVCDKIDYFSFSESEWAYSVAPAGSVMPMHETTALKIMEEQGCLSVDDISAYFGDEDYTAYFWHISNLVIYDKPKELSEFEKPHEYIYQSYRKQNSFFKGITRPPQSWGYVEELI